MKVYIVYFCIAVTRMSSSIRDNLNKQAKRLLAQFRDNRHAKKLRSTSSISQLDRVQPRSRSATQALFDSDSNSRSTSSSNSRLDGSQTLLIDGENVSIEDFVSPDGAPNNLFEHINQEEYENENTEPQVSQENQTADNANETSVHTAAVPVHTNATQINASSSCSCSSSSSSMPPSGSENAHVDSVPDTEGPKRVNDLSWYMKLYGVVLEVEDVVLNEALQYIAKKFNHVVHYQSRKYSALKMDGSVVAFIEYNLNQSTQQFITRDSHQTIQYATILDIKTLRLYRNKGFMRLLIDQFIKRFARTFLIRASPDGLSVNKCFVLVRLGFKYYQRVRDHFSYRSDSDREDDYEADPEPDSDVSYHNCIEQNDLELFSPLSFNFSPCRAKLWGLGYSPKGKFTETWNKIKKIRLKEVLYSQEFQPANAVTDHIRSAVQRLASSSSSSSSPSTAVAFDGNNKVISVQTGGPVTIERGAVPMKAVLITDKDVHVSASLKSMRRMQIT
jgi:hypothetical protein